MLYYFIGIGSEINFRRDIMTRRIVKLFTRGTSMELSRKLAPQLFAFFDSQEVEVELVPWEGSPANLEWEAPAVVRLPSSCQHFDALFVVCQACGHLLFRGNCLVRSDGSNDPAGLISAAEELVNRLESRAA